MRQLSSIFATLSFVALAALHPAGPVQADVKGLNVVAPEEQFPRVSRSYQSMDERFSRPGTVRSVAQVLSVEVGSSKSTLVRAVGEPVSAFSDGSWNFNVALRLPQKNRLICQYRVYFDDQDRVKASAWRRPQCADIINGL